jgi:hypothetical protein
MGDLAVAGAVSAIAGAAARTIAQMGQKRLRIRTAWRPASGDAPAQGAVTKAELTSAMKRPISRSSSRRSGASLAI